MQARLERGDRARAGGVRHKVRAAEVEAVRDPPRNHVAEKARKGALLPGLVVVLDQLDDLLDPALGQPRLPERIPPDRVVQTRAHLDDEFRRRSHAENHARPAQIRIVRELAGILEHPLGRDQREKLRRIRRRDRRRRHPELHRVEGHRIKVPTTLRVRHVRSAWIGIVIVLDQPCVRGNVGEAVCRGDDVTPEAE